MSQIWRNGGSVFPLTKEALWCSLPDVILVLTRTTTNTKMWMTSALRAMFLWMATLVFRVVFKQVKHKVVRSITARDTDEQMLKNIGKVS